MKYLKIYEDYNRDSRFKRFGIKNYTINSDGSVDVQGNVDISYQRLVKIPFKFNKVTGDFNCSNNNLKNLDGCPTHVGKTFTCSENLLTDLKNGPTEVGSDYDCFMNQLETLDGCAVEIGKDLYCGCNKLEALDTVASISGDIHCHGNKFYKIETGFMGWCGGQIYA